MGPGTRKDAERIIIRGLGDWNRLDPGLLGVWLGLERKWLSLSWVLSLGFQTPSCPREPRSPPSESGLWWSERSCPPQFGRWIRMSGDDGGGVLGR